MTQEKIIACKDCIHYHRDREYGHAVCFRPYHTTVDYCTGEYVQNSVYRSITEERSYFCGHSAKFFEPKPTLKEKVIQFFKKGNT